MTMVTMMMMMMMMMITKRALGGAHVLPTKWFQRLAVNKTTLKPCVAAATGAQ